MWLKWKEYIDIHRKGGEGERQPAAASSPVDVGLHKRLAPLKRTGSVVGRNGRKPRPSKPRNAKLSDCQGGLPPLEWPGPSLSSGHLLIIQHRGAMIVTDDVAEAAFSAASGGGAGATLTLDQLTTAFRSAGAALSQDDILAMAKKDGKSSFSLEQFKQLLKEIGQKPDNAADDLLRLLRLHDSQGTGSIPVAAFKSLLQDSLGEPLTDEEAQAAIETLAPNQQAINYSQMIQKLI
eukprot:GHVT01015933.1.p1 GENE.GHVT01015933.1~~GHVT01015933.1.p1  ORF type:complete len:236 (-),score=37.75 GHVT01015933.1:166-873(-)